MIDLRIKMIRSLNLIHITCLVVLCFSIVDGQQPAASLMTFGKIMVRSIDSAVVEVAGINEYYAGQMVSEDAYAGLTKAILTGALQEGFLYPVLVLKAVHPAVSENGTLLNPEFRLDRGERIVIDTVIYEGAEHTAPELLRRESAVLTGQTPDSKKIAAFIGNFRNYPFLTLKSQPEIVLTREGRYGLVVQMAEHSTNAFSGVVGYVPPTATAKGYVTGEVDINLNNISGRGRRLNVFWAKPDRNSQQIEMSYFEPWILRSNYSFTGEFSQMLRDTLVVVREFDAGIGRRLFRRGSASLNLNYTATMPTVGGRELLGLTDLSTRGVGLTVTFDSRDYPANPRKGILIGGNTYVSRRTDDGERLWQYQLELNGETVLRLRPQLVVANIWSYKGKWLSEGAPVYSDYYWFGGARSLRGYANDLFGGAEIAWLSSELRWLIGKNGRAHLFFDQGYYRLPVVGPDNRNYPHSYGLGLRLDSRAGVIGLDYGFGEGDTFTTAKIHVFLESNF